MNRQNAIARAETYFDDGSFFADLARRVAFRTESQEPDQSPELLRYLTDEMMPCLKQLGFDCEVLPNPVDAGGPFLVAERLEGPLLPTVFTYGHGDVVRGYDDQWADGLRPWQLVARDGRWYGRGTADNKGQHTINLAALAAVLEERGSLGFNVKLVLETGEERGSPGLREFCAQNRDRLQADVLIASDGPRLSPARPTLFMGSRGVFNFKMSLNLRQGAHHSGNWGGLLANPGIILAHALTTIVSKKGEVLVAGLRPPEAMSNSVRAAIADLAVDGGDDAPDIDCQWGEPGLTAGEKVFGWNTFEVLAYKTGNPNAPVNAIPPSAEAVCHIRYVPPTDPKQFLPALRRHLNDQGYPAVELEALRDTLPATRLDPDHPWVKWAVACIEQTTGAAVDVLPNLGGSLPNDAFSEILAMPTVWVPHSYASCSQHAPNEHILESVSRDALAVMAGIWWDLGAGQTPVDRKD